MSLAAGRKGIEAAARVPRCGAKAKSTGEPCRLAAMTNGRCQLHGGKTPAGVNWHKRLLPEKNDPRGIAKYEAKIAAAEKRDATREQTMSPEELVQLERWRQTHAPGSRSERARRRQDREAAALIKRLLADRDVRDEPHRPEPVDIFS